MAFNAYIKWGKQRIALNCELFISFFFNCLFETDELQISLDNIVKKLALLLYVNKGAYIIKWLI